MFSGIVEETAAIMAAESTDDLVRITVARPAQFTDLKPGDSISVNGVCLTVENFDAGTMVFSLGPETLQITGWSSRGVVQQVMNLERSLRLNDRLHGHLVTGHVDGTGEVIRVQDEAETRTLAIRFPPHLAPYFWRKGSVAVNGVSLTLNAVEAREFSVGLIPETLKRTNLGSLKAGDRVNLEVDNWARGMVHQFRLEREANP